MNMEGQTEPTVSSFKLVRKGKRVGVEVTHTHQYVDAAGNTVSVESPAQFHRVEPHPDLLALMHQLSPHYSNLVEQSEHGSKECVSKNVVEEASSQFPVRCVIFKDGKGYTGVQLSGYKKLSTGHACNMLTRLVKFNDPSDAYELTDELQEVVEGVRAEVVSLVGGKHAKPAQTSITDPEQVEEPEEA